MVRVFITEGSLRLLTMHLHIHVCAHRECVLYHTNVSFLPLIMSLPMCAYARAHRKCVSPKTRRLISAADCVFVSLYSCRRCVSTSQGFSISVADESRCSRWCVSPAEKISFLWLMNPVSLCAFMKPVRVSITSDSHFSR